MFPPPPVQVVRIKYRRISPERPLTNLFTSYRSVFTPLQRVSLYSYNIAWESQSTPTAMYISFVK